MRLPLRLTLALLAGAAGLAPRAEAQTPLRSRDRGTGVPTSMFATYVERGQLLVYPFFAYSVDHNLEYQPGKLGFGVLEDFRGRFRSTEEQVFIAYGLTARLAIEFETGFSRARLDKSPSDTSGMPSRIEESGFADVETQLRFRVLTETEGRPEVFGYLETTLPSQRRKVLIGDREWDLKPGIGVVRGYGWGTMTARVTVEYNRDDRHTDLGEFSIEYLRRLSPAWRVNLAIEGGESGAPDEWTLVSGVQWRLGKVLRFRFDNAVGLSSKATDWAPQVGLMFSLPR